MNKRASIQNYIKKSSQKHDFNSHWPGSPGPLFLFFIWYRAFWASFYDSCVTLSTKQIHRRSASNCMPQMYHTGKTPRHKNLCSGSAAIVKSKQNIEPGHFQHLMTNKHILHSTLPLKIEDSFAFCVYPWRHFFFLNQCTVSRSRLARSCELPTARDLNKNLR